MSKIRVLIADDQTLMRDGLRTILDLEDDLEVVGTAENGQEALELSASLQPDLVLMDVRMPVMDGVECTRRMKEQFAGIKVLVLTTFDEDETIIDALAHGADGFLLKEIPSEQLVQSVRDCAKGQLMLPAKIAAKLAARLSDLRVPSERIRSFSDAEANFNTFTEREKRIAFYMAQNCSNKEIAQRMNITEGTVKNYISIIYDKIGTNERLKAITLMKKWFLNGEDRE